MNYEKQNGLPKRRPLPTIGTESPKLPGRGSSLPKAAGSPASTGVSSRRKESHLDRNGVEDGYSEEGIATPVRTFLSSNITPRSGARKARAETASPSPHNTPNGTPNVSRPVSSKANYEKPTEDSRAPSAMGLRISATGKRSRAGSIISDGPDSSVSSRPVPMKRKNSATIVNSPEDTPKFFHANDVRSKVPSKSLGERPLPRLPGYQESQEEIKDLSNAGPSALSESPIADVQSPKFFYINDLTESNALSPRLANGIALSRPPLQTIYSAHTAGTPPRAPSPLKDEVLPRKSSINKASPRRHTRLVSNGGTEIKQAGLNSNGNGDLSRRSSVSSPRPPSAATHRRSSSVQSAGPSPPRRPSTAMSDTSPKERTRTTSLIGANGALPHSINPPAITQELPPSPSPQPPRSPTKVAGASQSKLDQMNELAAKARRERKVLDLEISNSSLLAINRALEREMRKQTAELRRYRRLSRSGRMSMAPARSASGKMSIMSETDTNIESDDLLTASEEEEDLEDLLSNLSSVSTRSRPSSAGHAARARFQDPARVQLDLEAHRALLLDSQKLNSSIKRCLSQSEALVSSAKRALEYEAPVPEPENLGARVLTPDDIEDENLGQGLLSPSINPASVNPWERTLGSNGSLDEGLSTPDYSRWGPPTAPWTPSLEDREPPWTAFESAELDGELQDERHDGASEFEIQREDLRLAEADTALHVRPRSPPKYELQPQSMLKPKPSLPSRRVSDISIDGVDDSSESDTSTDEERTLQSFTERARTPEGRSILEKKQIPKPPDPSPGDAGYRGSMQGLGHYLQAFSIFAAKQEA
ncbi:hypothetical protein P7C71_g3363, partial [Lecanoromycetidae sp. Uapishka_2]